MMKKYNLNLLATMILVVGAFAFTACSSDDDNKVDDGILTAEKLAGVWVTDYSQSGTEGDLSWNRVVEDYKFDADGTGYYECYRLEGEKYVDASSVRDNDSLHFTINGNTVTITGDKNNMKQTLTYTDGKLTMVNGSGLMVNGQFTKATADQVAFIHELYAEWQGGNSGNTTSYITYIERSWDGEKVVDKEVEKGAFWLNEIQGEKGHHTKLFRQYWYVTGNHTKEGGIFVEDGNELNIILCDDATLTLQTILLKGKSTLRIFGQKRGTGQLVITDPGDGHCAIGTYENGGGTIEIHGGNITAKGGKYCPAIGERCRYDGDNRKFYTYHFSDIRIYGGVINATGGDGAAGIGGGLLSYNKGNVHIYGGDISAQGGGYVVWYDYYGGSGIGGGCGGIIASVNIYGGNINATGGSEAAGIGCGESAEKEYNGKGVINISGGIVEATGADHAAGIGGGDGVYFGKITISGGDVKAHGGVNAAGIGGGEGAQGGNIEIKGGTVHTWAGADGAGIGGGEDGDGGTITISGGLVFAYGMTESNNGFGAGIGGGQDGNSGTITISGGEVHAYGGDDAAGIGTGEETTSGPNIKTDNITISGGTVEAVGGGYGAGIGAGQDAEVGTITVTTESGSVYVSGRSGDDCGWWAGAFGAYKEDARGTLNIGKGVKVIGITDFNNGITWTDIPVELNPVAWIYERCHVQLKTCDHPGYTAETCIYCKH